MSSFIPKNAKVILKSSKLQQDFFLKPYGLDAPKTVNFPKKAEPQKFVDLPIKLHRPGNEVQERVLTFRCDEQLSKPEIKQYLSKLYQLNIEKVNTARFMGTVYRDMRGRPRKGKNWKKVYVITNHQIDPMLNSPID